jgi:hypothetical protein
MFMYRSLYFTPHHNADKTEKYFSTINPLNTELNPIGHLLALLGAHHIFHVSELRVNDTALGKILLRKVA